MKLNRTTLYYQPKGEGLPPILPIKSSISSLETGAFGKNDAMRLI
ncbi:hypothetical protein [Porphyromonas levii]|nr:hypothetical protein [Porphyromonas levii]